MLGLEPPVQRPNNAKQKRLSSNFDHASLTFNGSFLWNLGQLGVAFDISPA